MMCTIACLKMCGKGNDIEDDELIFEQQLPWIHKSIIIIIQTWMEWWSVDTRLFYYHFVVVYNK